MRRKAALALLVLATTVGPLLTTPGTASANVWHFVRIYTDLGSCINDGVADVTYWGVIDYDCRYRGDGLLLPWALWEFD